MNPLRFRQVHLDFHTSEAIRPVGHKFDARQFQEALKRGHVDSITLFSKCRHGLPHHYGSQRQILVSGHHTLSLTPHSFISSTEANS
jgi:hypothetical protein